MNNPSVKKEKEWKLRKEKNDSKIRGERGKAK
jgi:hypothetical protein